MFRMSIGIMNGESRPGPLLQENLVLVRGGAQAADARPNEHPRLVPVNLVQVQARVQQGLVGGEDGELGEAIRPPDILRRGEGRGGIEVVDFRRNPAVEGRGVEGGDGVDAALAVEDVFPKGLGGVPER